jgi:hypothetical protein
MASIATYPTLCNTFTSHLETAINKLFLLSPFHLCVVLFLSGANTSTEALNKVSPGSSHLFDEVLHSHLHCFYINWPNSFVDGTGPALAPLKQWHIHLLLIAKWLSSPVSSPL